jgi:hypothetical protein
VSGLTSENESLGAAIDVEITVAASNDTPIRLTNVATPDISSNIAFSPLPCSVVGNRQELT